MAIGKHLRFLLLLIAMCSANCMAQKSSGFSGGVAVTAGDLIKIHGEYPENGMSLLAEVQWMWQTNSEKKWAVQRNLPVLGFSCVLADFGNPDVLGRAIGMLPQLMQRWSAGKSYFYLRGGLGLGYFTRSYHISDNPENLVFGSRLSNLSHFGAGFGFKVNDHHLIEIGGSLMHASNAHVRVPNIGGNVVGVQLGWRMRGEKDLSKRIESLQENTDSSGWHPSFQLGYGWHSFPGTVRPIGGPLYSTYGATFWMTQRSTNLADWSLGIHYHYYSAYEQYALTQELFDVDDARRNAHVLVAFAGREWFFGHCSFFLQAGVNLYSPFLRQLNEVWDLPKHGWMYLNLAHKVGYRYYPDEGLTYLGVSVKTNGGTADMFEFSVGRVLKKRKAG